MGINPDPERDKLVKTVAWQSHELASTFGVTEHAGAVSVLLAGVGKAHSANRHSGWAGHGAEELAGHRCSCG